MKVQITSYLDVLGDTIKYQVEYAKRLGLSAFSLRLVNKKKIYELTESEIQEIKETLRKEKVKILEIDSMIPSYNCHDSKGLNTALEILEKTVNIANELSVLNIKVLIPEFSSKTEDYKIVIDIVNKYAKITDKNKKRMLLKNDNVGLKTSLHHIMNGVSSKYVGIHFSPSNVYLNDISISSQYRVLKKFIFSVNAADVNDDGTPQLIGYGKADIIDVFQRLIRDNYKNYVTLDVDFNNFIDEVNKETVSREKGLFKRKKEVKETPKNKKYFLFKKRLGIETEREITAMDVMDNQIKVLNKIFK